MSPSGEPSVLWCAPRVGGLVSVVWAGEEVRRASLSQGTGASVGSASLLVDGILPDEEAAWDSSVNVWWSDSSAFVIDLGAVRVVEHLMGCVDNNDTYLIEASEDGESFVELVTIPADVGEIEGGMDCMSSREDHPECEPALAFEPVRARYVRIRAIEGDEAYTVGELQLEFGPGNGPPVDGEVSP